MRQAEHVGFSFATLALGGATLVATFALTGDRADSARTWTRDMEGCSLPTREVQLRPSPPEPSCDIVEYGLYEPRSERILVEDAASVTGVSGITDDVEFTTATDVIPRQPGAGFGIRYVAHDVPAGAVVTWRVVYPTPLRGFADWHHDEAVEAGDHVRHVLYDFDHAWEMLPGAWQFEVQIDGQTRCGFAFTVQ